MRMEVHPIPWTKSPRVRRHPAGEQEAEADTDKPPAKLSQAPDGVRLSIDRQRAFRRASPDWELQEDLLGEGAHHVSLTPDRLNLRGMLGVPTLPQTIHDVAPQDRFGETLTRTRDKCWRTGSLPERAEKLGTLRE